MGKFPCLKLRYAEIGEMLSPAALEGTGSQTKDISLLFMFLHEELKGFMAEHPEDCDCPMGPKAKAMLAAMDYIFDKTTHE